MGREPSLYTPLRFVSYWVSGMRSRCCAARESNSLIFYSQVPKLRVCALRVTETARARILKVGEAGVRGL